LHKAEQDGEQDDHGNGHRLDAVAQKGRKQGSDEQDYDQDVLELLKQNVPRRYTFSGLQLIRAIFASSVSC